MNVQLSKVVQTIIIGCVPWAINVGAEPLQSLDQGYEPPIYQDGKLHLEEKTDKFGSFSVIRKVEDHRSVPILHGPWLIRKSLLEWNDSSGRIGFSIADDGASVRLSVNGESLDRSRSCIIGAVIMGYSQKLSTVRNWRNLQPVINRQVRSCSAISSIDMQRVKLEMEGSDAEYILAANAWKAVSAELHGTTRRRCVAERIRPPVSMPPNIECVRYSNP